jgi:hypothetical protein
MYSTLIVLLFLLYLLNIYLAHIFVFRVSGLSLQQNNITFIQEYFRHQSSIWEGWELSEDGDKIGFIPSEITQGQANGKNSGQLMVLDFQYSQKIR